MNRRPPIRRWIFSVLIISTLALQACDRKQPASPEASPPAASTENGSQPPYVPVTVRHALGTTVIDRLPQRVIALDMNEVDFLEQLGVPVVGMPKDFVPHFLARYRDAPEVADVGAIVQPNLERVHAARPDLILITSLQASHYQELSKIAPTIHFDVDYRNSQVRHIDVVKDHLLTLGAVFGRQEIARQKAVELDARIDAVKQATHDRADRALVVMHNNGAYSSFGEQSRYGFVFNAFGVKPAGPAGETGLHGQPISSEFIQQANPDVIFVVDRSAVMERTPALDAERLSNPLLRQTTAWKTGRVVFADAQAWYVTAASPTSLKLMIDDVIKGYPR